MNYNSIIWFTLLSKEQIPSNNMLISTCVVSCISPTLWDPTDWNPPSSSVHGILQARILERVAMPSSRGSS